MMKCWEADVEHRFSFKKIVVELTKEETTNISVTKCYTA